MSVSQRGLGRGLEALFRNSENTDVTSERRTEVSVVPLAALSPNPKQPRRHFAAEALEELAASIRSQGIVQPLLVRPAGNARYEIVAGERRWRAAALAGLNEIPVLVRKLSDMEVMAAALIENLQREDLNPLEEARAMATLRDQFGLSQDELAGTLGKSRSTVANALRLLNLNLETQEYLEQGRLSAGHARAVLSLAASEAQTDLARHIVQETLTVRDAEYAAAQFKEKGLFPWANACGKDAEPAAEQPDVPDAGAADGRRKTRSRFLLAARDQLCRSLKVRAGISGSETHGRISLNYASRDELHTLLRLLGVDVLDVATPEQE